MATIAGIVLGAILLGVAHVVLTNAGEEVEAVTAAIDLTTTVIGYISLAAGLVAAIAKAIPEGIAGLTPETAAGPALFAVTGAILLIG